MRVFIIHGFQSSPERNWFKWLSIELEKLGAQVYIPAMPSPENPSPEKWAHFLRKIIGKLDSETFFIAHSLGCIGTLRYLAAELSESSTSESRLLDSKNVPRENAKALDSEFLESALSESAPKVGGIALVSGFYEPLPIYPELDHFSSPRLSASDFALFRAHIAARLVLSARDDAIVPSILSQNLANALEASFIQTPRGNHFMQDDGFSSFPLLLNALKFHFFK